MKSTSLTAALASKRQSSLLVVLFRVFRSNENSIRDEVANLPRILKGPQGNVASKTVESFQILKCFSKS